VHVEEIALDQITPYPGNPRQISRKAISKVVDSLREFGPQQPIVVDAQMIIVVGHARLAAAKRLKMITFPCHIARNLSREQAAAYRLMDNRSHEEAEWDADSLKIELGALSGLDYDLALTGFDEQQLSDLMNDAEWPALPSGDREPFQSITFRLHDDQVATLKEAVRVASNMGKFSGPNQNRNGNALARIAEVFLEDHGQG